MNHKLSFEFEKVNFPTTKSFYSFSKRLEGDDFGKKEFWFEKIDGKKKGRVFR